MKSLRLLSVILVLALSSLACFSARTQTPSNILFSDDFSNTSKKWDQVTDSTHTTDYYNDAYRIIVNGTDSHVWANPKAGNFSDTRIEVDAIKNGGPDDNDFGIICRYTDPGEFYYGVVSSDGFYGIYKVTSAGGESLGNDSMLESDSVVHGGGTNHIRFECVGTTLSLYVNGSLVDKQIDTDLSTGNVGLMAGSYETSGTDILFDNFFVYTP